MNQGFKPAKCVLYHAGCLDGFASAWAAWTELGDDAHYQAVRHREPLPRLPNNATVYILDFCYPMEQLVAAAKHVAQIVVLDHHISALEEYQRYRTQNTLPDNLLMYFDLDRSGCMIAWSYFHSGQSAPKILEYIEDRDLWRHRWEETSAITHALYLRCPMPFEKFSDLPLAALKAEGEVLIKQHRQQVQHLLHSRHAVVLNGVTGLAVNAPSLFSSELGQALAKLSGTFGLTYHYHGKRRQWECQLRSVGDFDVSELASFFGGGGHLRAAGFSTGDADLFKSL